MFRRRQQQDEGSAPPNVYKMRQSLISIGDDYWIENGAGQRAFRVDGKAFRIRKTLVIEDPAGNEVATLKEKLVSVRDVMTIERGGQVLATVKKALFTPLRERFDGRGRTASSTTSRATSPTTSTSSSATASRSRRSRSDGSAIRDTYGVEIGPNEDVALVLAATVALDQMTHDVG